MAPTEYASAASLLTLTRLHERSPDVIGKGLLAATVQN